MSTLKNAPSTSAAFNSSDSTTFHNPIDTPDYHFRVRHTHKHDAAVSSISFPFINGANAAVDSPALYFTAGNDGYIKAWSADSTRALYSIATPEPVTMLHTCSIKSPVIDGADGRLTVNVIFASCGNRIMVIEVFGLEEIKEAVEFIDARGAMSNKGSLVASGDVLSHLKSLSRSFREFERQYRNRKNIGRTPFSFKFMRYENEKAVALRERGISRKQMSRFVSHSGLAENFLRMLVSSDLQVSRKQLYANMKAHGVTARTICLMLAKLPFEHKGLLRCFSEAPAQTMTPSSSCHVKRLYTLLRAQFVPHIILHLEKEKGLKPLVGNSKNGTVGMIPLRDFKGEKDALIPVQEDKTDTIDKTSEEAYFYCTSVASDQPVARIASSVAPQRRPKGVVAHFSPAKQLNRIKHAQNLAAVGLESRAADTLLEKDSLKFPNFSPQLLIDVPPAAEEKTPAVRESCSPVRPKALSFAPSALETRNDLTSPSSQGFRPEGQRNHKQEFQRNGRSLVIPKQLDLIEHPGKEDILSSFDDVNRALISLTCSSSDAAHALETQPVTNVLGLSSQGQGRATSPVAALLSPKGSSPLPARPSPSVGAGSLLMLRWTRNEAENAKTDLGADTVKSQMDAPSSKDTTDVEISALLSKHQSSAKTTQSPSRLTPKKPLKDMFPPSPLLASQDAECLLKLLQARQVHGMDVQFMDRSREKRKPLPLKSPNVPVCKRLGHRSSPKTKIAKPRRDPSMDVLYRHILFHDSLPAKEESAGSAGAGGTPQSARRRMNLKPWTSPNVSQSPDGPIDDGVDADQLIVDSLLAPLMNKVTRFTIFD